MAFAYSRRLRRRSATRPGMRIRGPGVDFVLEPRDQFGRSLTIRAPGASRRHETTAQFADHFLGNLGVLVDRVQIQFRQRQAARSEPCRYGSPDNTDR